MVRHHICLVICGCPYMVHHISLLICGCPYMVNHIWATAYDKTYMSCHMQLAIYGPSYIQTQRLYNEYCKVIRERYSDEFWRVFASVHDQRVVLVDKVLKACRDVYVRDESKRMFALSVRSLRKNMLSYGGDFTQYLMHEIRIPVEQFGLPDLTEPVVFRFLNPLWAWVQAANKMVKQGNTMHFVPKAMFHETSNERLYGAGVRFGDKLKFSASRTPQGGKPALFGMSFDGGDSGVSARSVYPYCVSVLNFDGADPLACGLVGFQPRLVVPPKVKAKEKFRLAAAYVQQRCIGAILDVLEGVARDGFRASIGGEVSRFHPFLVAIRVDTKEKKSYFGLRSDRSCAICRFRQGWSTLRRGTPHGKTHIQRLWSLAIDTPQGSSYMTCHIWLVTYGWSHIVTHILSIIYDLSYADRSEKFRIGPGAEAGS